MLKFVLSKLESSPNRRVVKNLAEYFFLCASLVLRWFPLGKKCPVCAAVQVAIYRPVVSDSLVREWNINGEWLDYFNRREGEICLSCGGSIRGRQLSLALMKWLADSKGVIADSMESLVKHPGVMELKVAEINSCGAMHKKLKKLKGLAYSEYAPEDPSTRHEDLLELSHPDESFDIVLHSDTLEHIPNVDRALSEICRVLKPGGAMICSIPVVRDSRPTLNRASLEQGVLVEHMAPSYHGGSYQKTRQYLVCSEFGEDIFDRIKNHGFDLEVLEHPSNPAAFSLIAVKKP